MNEHTHQEPFDPEPPESPRLGPPWEQTELDLAAKVWQTIVGVVSNPMEFFAQLRREGGIFPPYLFYLVVAWPAVVVGTLLQAPFDMMMGSSGGQTMITFFVVLLLSPIFLFIGLIISSGLTHLGLMIFGGANHPFEATYRVNAYAYGGVSWLMAIPFCGGTIAFIWGIVLEILGIAKVQEISTGKAAAAVLIPLAVIFLVFICIGVVFAGVIAAAIGSM